jgi:hypothetical protein
MGKGTVLRVAELYPLNTPAHPYLYLPSNALLLYLLVPLVVLASLILFLSPGIFLVLSSGSAYTWSGLLIRAFGVSFITYTFLISIVKLVLPLPLNPTAFMAIITIGGVLAWSILAYRVLCGAKLPWPLSQKQDVRRLLWTLGIPVILVLLLTPILFWQDMHDDGFEVLELGRSLSAHLLPQFPNPTGLSGLGQGMLPMAYPVHWFITLFGPLETAARFPILLYLPVLFCILLQLIEINAPRRMGPAEEALLLLALGVYTITMTYNSSYDPYFADIAAPAAAETLTVLCLVAMIYHLWMKHTYWFLIFALLSYLCRPTGLLVLGFFALGILFFCLREDSKALLMRVGAAIVLCVLITLLYEKIYIPSVIGDTGTGYPFGSLLRRFRYLKVDDLSRISYVLFPSGILPFLSLLAFRWQDSLARVIAFVSFSYFIFFFFPAFVALHHFVPVMVLPLVVFWRINLHRGKRFRRVSIPAVAVAAFLALWMSLPRHFEINRTVRLIGQKTTCLIGDYDSDYQTQVKHAKFFFQLLPPDWEVKDPTKELVSGYCSIIYYSTRPKILDIPINYIFQPLDYQPPSGFTKIAEDKTATLYVKDLEEWHHDRFRPLRADYRSLLYDIPRTTLFRYWGTPKGEYSIDLRKLLMNLKSL